MRPIDPIPRDPALLDGYWRLVAERQRIFYAKARGDAPPWTADPVLGTKRFTNVCRESDRISQDLLRVIYNAEFSQTPEDVLTRILLFRFFNLTRTWVGLLAACGEPTARGFDPDRWSAAAHRLPTPVFNGAYLIAPPPPAFGVFQTKAEAYIRLIRVMLDDDLSAHLAAAPSMEAVYQRLCGYPMIGKFVGYQVTLDVNYSTIVNFSEDDFCVAGPGAVRGIAKTFGPVKQRGGWTDTEIIHWMVGVQEEWLERLGYDPAEVQLPGRRFTAANIQNCFCEWDKYLRVARPDLGSDRMKIKQNYVCGSGQRDPIQYFYPPKWGVDMTDIRWRGIRAEVP